MPTKSLLLCYFSLCRLYLLAAFLAHFPSETFWVTTFEASRLQTVVPALCSRFSNPKNAPAPTSHSHSVLHVSVTHTHTLTHFITGSVTACLGKRNTPNLPSFLRLAQIQGNKIRSSWVFLMEAKKNKRTKQQNHFARRV